MLSQKPQLTQNLQLAVAGYLNLTVAYSSLLVFAGVTPCPTMLVCSLILNTDKKQTMSYYISCQVRFYIIL